jgi:hypothetical protein
MKIVKRQLVRIIREELLREEEKALSSSEFKKQMIAGAADMAASIPAALKDDAQRMIEMIPVMAKFDRAAFGKIKGYMDTLGAKALEKHQKGEKPEEAAG